MDMTGEQRIAASREVVWAALNNPDILRACIPGCQELTKISDTEMTATAVIKVGPISARFQGAVILADLDPPNGYRILGEGQGGVAGHARGGAVVRLIEDGTDTLLTFEVSAQIGGKLAQLGSRMIDATAKSMSTAFFKKFAAEIAEQRSPAPVGENTDDASALQRTNIAPAARLEAVGTVPDRFTRWISVAALVLATIAVLITLRGGPPMAASPDLYGAVQLLLVLAVGYLLGRQRAAAV